MADVTAINGPAHIKCGALDFIFHRSKIKVGYIETKYGEPTHKNSKKLILYRKATV
jgi:hypothetical protein